jgi:hypothetical protein
MKKSILLLLFLAMQTVLLAQEYYPEGTKWTEIRLDTLKYDSWYSKVDDEWVPNFETIEYYVKGDYIEKSRGDGKDKYRCVYTNGPEWTDSLTLLLQEEGDADYVGQDCVMVSVLTQGYDWNDILTNIASWPGMAYQFDWGVGKGLYYQDIVQEQTTYIVRYTFYYGIIDEIKEGYFGGVRPLKYVDLDGKAPECGKWDNPQKVDTQGGRIIQGIGITEWNQGECLFGAPRPYDALRFFQEHPSEERHYRSRLVHFERNGEVLYDIWPAKGITDEIMSIHRTGTTVSKSFYDLLGRRLQGRPAKGVYIKDGRKYVAE